MDRVKADAAAVVAIVRQAKSSFYWGMRILPPERRLALYAIYAYCRVLDDIADADRPVAERMAQLDGWEAEIGRIGNGTPLEPVGRVLQQAVARFSLPVDELLLILDGMRDDLHRGPAATPWQDIRQYARKVAGAVGVLSVPVFGDPSPAAKRFAVALGEALQLTNILRDVAEDAARGRIYLPVELLQQYGIPASISPQRLLGHPGLPDVCRGLADECERSFLLARELLQGCNQRALRGAVLMMQRYEQLLRKLQKELQQVPCVA